jgi:hypothetical protein
MCVIAHLDSMSSAVTGGLLGGSAPAEPGNDDQGGTVDGEVFHPRVARRHKEDG